MKYGNVVDRLPAHTSKLSYIFLILGWRRRLFKINIVYFMGDIACVLAARMAITKVQHLTLSSLNLP